MKSQNAQILAALERGEEITPLDALRDYGCMRLGARIWELKADGWNIASRPVKTAGGARVAQYWLRRVTGPPRTGRREAKA